MSELVAEHGFIATWWAMVTVGLQAVILEWLMVTEHGFIVIWWTMGSVELQATVTLEWFGRRTWFYCNP